MSDTKIRVVAGNTFQVEKYDLDLVESDGSSFKKEISIGAEEVAKKQASQNQQVAQVDIADA